MPRTGHPIEAHASFRFEVAIGRDGKSFTATFTECVLPSLQVETMDVKEGGQNAFTHKLPMRVNAGTIKLKHGITKDLQMLYWYFRVMEGNIEDATFEITVTLQSTDHQVIAQWHFLNAYPIKWVGPQLKTDNNSVAIEEIELVYHGFQVGQSG